MPVFKGRVVNRASVDEFNNMELIGLLNKQDSKIKKLSSHITEET